MPWCSSKKQKRNAAVCCEHSSEAVGARSWWLSQLVHLRLPLGVISAARASQGPHDHSNVLKEQMSVPHLQGTPRLASSPPKCLSSGEVTWVLALPTSHQKVGMEERWAFARHQKQPRRVAWYPEQTALCPHNFSIEQSVLGLAAFLQFTLCPLPWPYQSFVCSSSL